MSREKNNVNKEWVSLRLERIEEVVKGINGKNIVKIRKTNEEMKEKRVMFYKVKKKRCGLQPLRGN